MVNTMKSQDRTKPATKKRGAARNDKGQFEPLSPYEDPELLDQLVRLVKAVIAFLNSFSLLFNKKF